MAMKPHKTLIQADRFDGEFDGISSDMLREMHALIEQMHQALGLAVCDVDWLPKSPTLPVLSKALNAATKYLEK